jgi:hypothetical protein
MDSMDALILFFIFYSILMQMMRVNLDEQTSSSLVRRKDAIKLTEGPLLRMLGDVGTINSESVYVVMLNAHKDLIYRNQTSLTGQPFGAVMGRYAMTVIGYRRETDKTFLLLLDMLLWEFHDPIEVDLEYLEACNATLGILR